MERMKASLCPDDQQSFENWTTKKHPDDIEKGSEIDFDFSLTTEEFDDFVGKTNSFKEFYYHLDHEQKRLFANLLMQRSLDSEDDLEPPEIFSGMEYFSRDEMATLYQNLERSCMDEAMRYRTNDLPKEPSSEEIEKAFDKLEENAKTHFKAVCRPNVIFPIPMDLSAHTDTSLDKEIKHLRIERVYKILKDGKSKNSSLKTTLLAIFQGGSLNKIDYEKLKQGEIVVDSTGALELKEDFLRRVKDNTAIRQKLENEFARRGIPMDSPEAVSEMMLDSNKLTLLMKKGEVLDVFPKNQQEIVELLDRAGVGAKKIIRKDPDDVQVESLEFWDEDVVDRLISQLNRLEDECEKSLEKIGHAKGHTKDVFNKAVEEVLGGYESLFENLAFTTSMASNGFRIIQGTNSNTMILTFPSESLMKGETEVPYITISLKEKNGVHFAYGNNDETEIRSIYGTLLVSMGHRMSRSRLKTYTECKPRYHTALNCLNEIRKESNLEPLTNKMKVRVLFHSLNININTSSLVDNVRCLNEIVMGDFSSCAEYISENMMVPTKNLLQVRLYHRTKKILKTINKSMSKVKVYDPIVDSEGNVDLDSARAVQGDFPSLIDEEASFYKPNHLFQECFVLFSLCPKGLHGSSNHNLKDQVEIQEDTDNNYKDDIFACSGFPEKRIQYKAPMIVVTSIMAENNMVYSTDFIRERVLKEENINESPFTSSTLASTRSTLVKEGTTFWTERGLEKAYVDFHLRDFKTEDLDELEDVSRKVENQIKDVRNTRRMTKLWMKEKRKLLSKHKPDSKEYHFILNRVYVNKITKTVEIKPEMSRVRFRLIANLVMKEAGNPEPRFFNSGLAITEMVKQSFETPAFTIGSYAKKGVLQDRPWHFCF